MKKTNGPNPQQPPESPALVAATAAVRETRRALHLVLDNIDYAWKTKITPTEQATEAAKLPALAAAYAAAWENYLTVRGIEK
jgi:hypothetical protein